MLRLFLSKLKLLRRVTNWCNCLENYQLLLLWIVLSPDLRISWTNLSCSAPASVRSPCRACSCCAACCYWRGRGWRGPRCPPSCPPPLPGRRTEGKTGSWNTFYWQPAEIKSEFFIFKKTDCKRGVLNVEKIPFWLLPGLLWRVKTGLTWTWMTWKREETWLQPEPEALNDQLLNIILLYFKIVIRSFNSSLPCGCSRRRDCLIHHFEFVVW